MADDPKLIALVGGRAFTITLAANTDVADAFDWLTWRGRNRANQPAPDPYIDSAWLDTDEGFRIRADAVTAFVIGHKQGEWATAARRE